MSLPGCRGATLLAAMFLLAAGAGGCVPKSAAPATAAAAAAREAAGRRTFVYVGLSSGDIATYEMNGASGALARKNVTAVGRAPTSLASSDERQVLVASDETGAAVISLAIHPKTGALNTVNRVAAGGAQPTQITVDRSGKYALLANSGSGSAAVVPIKPNGGLEPAEVYAAGGGAHAIAVHPANEVALVANARAGTITQYSFNTGTGVLTPKPGPPLSLPAGSAPTRFACHPSGRWVYILNEAGDDISVHVFDEDIRALSVLASQIISTLPDGAPGKKNRPFDLRMGRAGHFLYVTNRGHDTVATYAVDATGSLTLVGHEPSGGRAPAPLAADPSGSFLFVGNQGSKTLVVFRLDEKTGAPALAHTVPLAAVPLAIHSVRPSLSP
jgi:6-phosphogluconolactonase